MRSDLLDIEVYVHHVTERAALITCLETNASKVWVPLSWFEWASEPKDGTRGDAEITISRSRAQEKGIA